MLSGLAISPPSNPSTDCTLTPYSEIIVKADIYQPETSRAILLIFLMHQQQSLYQTSVSQKRGPVGPNRESAEPVWGTLS